MKFYVAVKAETSMDVTVDAEDELEARSIAESIVEEKLDSSKLPDDMYWEAIEAYDVQQ